MQEGSEILISEEDTLARQREAAGVIQAQAEQLAQRMEQQLQVQFCAPKLLSLTFAMGLISLNSFYCACIRAGEIFVL